jgi:hypothetical protein
MAVQVVNTASESVPVYVTSLALVAPVSVQQSGPIKVTDLYSGAELIIMPSSAGSSSNHEFSTLFACGVSLSAGASRITLQGSTALDTGVTYLVTVSKVLLTYLTGTAPSGVFAFQFTTTTLTSNVTSNATSYTCNNNVNANSGPFITLPIPNATQGAFAASDVQFEVVSALTTPFPTLQIIYSAVVAGTFNFFATVTCHALS